MRINKLLVLSLALIFNSFYAGAALRLPKVIGSNMVLQNKQAVPVWGWANKGDAVKVTFAGQTKGAVANAGGYWSVSLSPLKTSAKPATLTITQGAEKIELNNILVGEVWLCSGQSNMEYGMKGGLSKAPKNGDADSLATELSVNNPMIRLLTVDRKLDSTDVVTSGWAECGGKALEKFSAAGYFFAKKIQSKLNVPVGMIFSAWGGTPIEFWTPEDAYLKVPAFKQELDKTPGKINNLEAGKLYKNMIKPLAPFAIKGFLWYQGESNCITHDAATYAQKMEIMVNTWRDAFNNTNLPIYYVALAPHYYTHRKDAIAHTVETLPLTWEAQTKALTIPNTEMITTTDLVDDLNDIHPAYKWVVGRRLAAIALAKQYGFKNIEFTGPRYKELKAANHSLEVTFTHAVGLKTKDGKTVNWVTIAGADGQFKDAQTEVKNSKLIAWSDEVTNPTQIRVGWNEAANPNLVNNAGLPVMPFRANIAVQ